MANKDLSLNTSIALNLIVIHYMNLQL